MNRDYTTEALENTAKALNPVAKYEKDLKEMYDLGYKHGKAIGLKEAEFNKLKEESKDIGKTSEELEAIYEDALEAEATGN